MIPHDLPPGSLVRCIDAPPGGKLCNGSVYMVKGYHPNPGYSAPGPSVLLHEVPTIHIDGDHGWILRRFELARDRADYQRADDVDLTR